jgi:hypothetical protein
MEFADELKTCVLFILRNFHRILIFLHTSHIICNLQESVRNSNIADPGMFIPDPNFAIPDPGYEFFHPGSQIQGQKDSGTPIPDPHQRIEVFLTHTRSRITDPAVLRIRDVYPGSRILIFTHPGSRISDPGSKNFNKREG